MILNAGKYIFSDILPARCSLFINVYEKQNSWKIFNLRPSIDWFFQIIRKFGKCSAKKVIFQENCAFASLLRPVKNHNSNKSKVLNYFYSLYTDCCLGFSYRISTYSIPTVAWVPVTGLSPNLSFNTKRIDYPLKSSKKNFRSSDAKFGDNP